MEGESHMSPPVLFAGLLAAAHVATEERSTVADNPSYSPVHSLHAPKCAPRPPLSTRLLRCPRSTPDARRGGRDMCLAVRELRRRLHKI